MNSPAIKTLQSLSTALWALTGLGAGATAAAANPVAVSLGETAEAADATATREKATSFSLGETAVRPKSIEAVAPRAIVPIQNPVTFSLGETAAKSSTAETQASLAYGTVLGTQASTSATALQEVPVGLQVDPKGDSELAQATRRRRRRTLRRDRPDENYIGLGLNLGIDGDTALGESETVAFFGRIKLARRFSLRPSVIIDDEAVISFPATFDIPLSGRNSTNLLPQTPIELFVGAGPLFTIDSETITLLDGSEGDSVNNEIGVATITGVDVPVSKRLTASANLIVGFSGDDVNVGSILGIAYRFPRR